MDSSWIRSFIRLRQLGFDPFTDPDSFHVQEPHYDWLHFGYNQFLQRGSTTHFHDLRDGSSFSFHLPDERGARQVGNDWFPKPSKPKSKQQQPRRRAKTSKPRKNIASDQSTWDDDVIRFHQLTGLSPVDGGIPSMTFTNSTLSIEKSFDAACQIHLASRTYLPPPPQKRPVARVDTRPSPASLTADVKDYGLAFGKMFSMRDYYRSLRTLRRKIVRLGGPINSGVIDKRIPIVEPGKNVHVIQTRDYSNTKATGKGWIHLMMKAWYMSRRKQHPHTSVCHLVVEVHVAWTYVITAKLGRGPIVLKASLIGTFELV